MKKRFLFPLIGVGALTGFLTLGAIVGNQEIKACNNGDNVACEELAQLHGADYPFADQITNPVFREAVKRETELQAIKGEGASKLPENKAKSERLDKER